MKRRLSVFIAIMMMLFALMGFLCGCENIGIAAPKSPDTTDSDSPNGDENGDNNNDTNTDTVYYIKVSHGTDSVHVMQKQSDGVYTYKITLSVGDTVSFYDSANNAYLSYNDAEFNGTITVAGEYTFTLSVSSGIIYVTKPQAQPNPNPNPNPNPDKPFASAVPTGTKTTVYYTNSEKWTNVYAYVWNYKTQAKKAAWPGENLTSFGTSGYGEKQYKIDVDYSVYDRIIFNDGAASNPKQTKDLVVSAATSGYFGKDGTFTMGTENYGKVTYTTLTDNTNLSYIPTRKKKISIYTPPNYTTSKKYGVLYVFDGQNLFEAADGAENETNGAENRWQVDVAVTNLVKNGGNGLIIVGIDNASKQRDQELTMSLTFGSQTSLGGANYGDFKDGKLDELGNFIKQTVMPYIENNYSVDTSREHTGIAGSSSGGLGAYYLGLRDNDLYGYIGAFSPANGIFTSASWTSFYKSKDFSAGKPKVYVYCGEKDSDLEDMLLPETKKIKSGLTAVGFSSANIIENYVSGARHNEIYWRIAFPEFLSKLAP